MSDTQQTDVHVTTEDAEKPTEQTFTQADVDRIVRERVKRERDKFADYDDLKAKAGAAKTAEERLAELEKRYADAETKALRSDIAARHGISTEDRDLFLTGNDEDTLTRQAEALAGRHAEQKKRTSNYVPSEGTNPRPAPDEMREFTRNLFKRAD